MFLESLAATKLELHIKYLVCVLRLSENILRYASKYLLTLRGKNNIKNIFDMNELSDQNPDKHPNSSPKLTL